VVAAGAGLSIKLSIKGQALRYLAQREHSRAELERKLLRALSRPARSATSATSAADVDAPAADIDVDAADALQARHQALKQDIAAALDELGAKGLVSDARTAAQLLTSKAPRFGVNRLRREMQLKGLDGALIASTLAQAKDGELAHAREVWRRKFGRAPGDAKDYGRQMRFLAGRGFSSAVIQRILQGRGDPED
jgi:regulatory protein